MQAMDGLGAVFNVIHEGSTVEVPLTQAGAVSFVSFLADGTHTLAFTQADSTGVESNADLNIFTISGTEGSNGVSRIFVGPGVGGTWTDVTASAANDNTADGATATNDTYVVTVRGTQLSDGYDSVICTASAGTCVAIVHDLKVMRKPANLKSSIVA